MAKTIESYLFPLSCPYCARIKFYLSKKSLPLLSKLDLMWFVGLFEGEGCLSINGTLHKWAMSISMSDEDVIIHVQEIIKCGSISLRRPQDNRKQMYNWRLTSRNELIWLLNQMHPYLGMRRSFKVSQALLDLYDPRCKNHRS